jgi:hypothetical protein
MKDYTFSLLKVKPKVHSMNMRLHTFGSNLLKTSSQSQSGGEFLFRSPGLLLGGARSSAIPNVLWHKKEPPGRKKVRRIESNYKCSYLKKMTRARIFKPFNELRNRFPAWGAGTTTRFVVQALQSNVHTVGWRNPFFGIDSWAPSTFTNTGSVKGFCNRCLSVWGPLPS